VAQGFLVAFIWSTSFVLVKIGLQDMPPLTFAGLRQTLAFILLLLWYLRSGEWGKLKSLSTVNWVKLASLGILQFTLTQGVVFVAMGYLPAATINLVVCFTTVFVAFIGMAVLAEFPTRLEWLGIAVAMGGALLYFLPLQVQPGQETGYTLSLVALLAATGATLLGRQINARGDLSPLLVTVVSICFGGLANLAAGLAMQGMPVITLRGWGIILWLAVVNTAFAFTLFNRTLRTLSAAEANMINNSMIIQIPVLMWIFLGESLSLREVIGLLVVTLGLVLVQLSKNRLPVVSAQY